MELLLIFIGPTYKVDKLSGSSPLIVYLYSGLEISSTISTSIELENNVCASTSCCVLLGGKKCVAGNANGPYMRSHYNDLSLNPKDHYFHQGKCYGNCITGPLSN